MNFVEMLWWCLYNKIKWALADTTEPKLSVCLGRTAFTKVRYGLVSNLQVIAIE